MDANALLQAALTAMQQASTAEEKVMYKMVLVVNRELKMKAGKMAAQCAHAAVGVFSYLVSSQATTEQRAALEEWTNQGQMKVVLRCPTLVEVQEIEAKAAELGVITYQVYDAGRTQVKAGSATVLAVGPAPIPTVNQLTKHLKLY
jgi:peptidyl-tRNA hydrolase